MDETLDLYRYIAEDKGVRLEVVSSDDCELQADPVRLRQVLANLLDNAIKYSDAQGLVRLSWNISSDQVMLEIADEGMGISLEDQAHVFERLYRADKSRGVPGMGLGLSLVKAVVEAHNGTIGLVSNPGHGCRVRIEFPRKTP